MATVFTLEAVAAKHGDCLFLHYGDAANPKLILIDGGPPGVYNKFLKKRINELRQTRQDPLRLSQVMVSHVDSDHIAGILEMTGKIEAAENAGKAPLCEIDEMWFNAFDDVLGNVEAAAFHADMNAAGLSSDLREAGATIASVGQGRTLRDRANRMGVRVNGGDRLIVGGWVWDMGDGLSFEVLGPLQDEIEAFQKAWDKEVKKKKWDVNPDAAAVAEYLDSSAFNLASTVVLAKLGSKSMLLTGDARGDHILKAARAHGLLTGNSMKVNILKIPHHGSDRNVKTDFFRKIRADHYIVSGDGHHTNPDIATLQMIRTARGSANYTVHMTYRDTIHGHKPHLDRFLNELPAAERGKFVFRDPAELSLRVDLGKAVTD